MHPIRAEANTTANSRPPEIAVGLRAAIKKIGASGRRRRNAVSPAGLPDRPPTVAFFGLFGVGNFGNEASLRAAREGLADVAPGANQVCVCEVPERVAEEHGLPAYSIRMAGPLSGMRPANRALRMLLRPAVELARAFAVLRFLRRIDAMVVPGTGIVDDFGVRPWQMPYDLFRWSLACRLTGTKLLYLSVGAGPIRSRLNRALLTRAAGFAGYCSYRDESSREYMATTGRDVTHDPVFPDLAFGLEPPPLDGRERSGAAVTVGIGVMSYRGWTGRGPEAAKAYARYLAKMTLFCRSLLGDGCRLRLVMGDAADEQMLRDLERALRPEDCGSGAAGLVVAPALTCFDDVLGEIAKTDVFVGTRFHNIVGALMMQRPVVSIGYAEKNRDLLGSFCLEEYSQIIDDLDVDALRQQIHEILALTELQPVIARMNAEFKAALAAQYRTVAGLAGLRGEPGYAPPENSAAERAGAHA